MSPASAARFARAAAALGLLACARGGPAPSATPQVPDPRHSLPLAAPDPSSRCFALAVGTPRPGAFSFERALVLDTALAPHATLAGRGAPVRRRARVLLEGGPRRDWHRRADWAATGPDSLWVGIGYGFSATTLALAGRGDTLAGTALTSADDGTAEPPAPALALRVPCASLAAGLAGEAVRDAQRALAARAGR